jgi:hypothetical protein
VNRKRDPQTFLHDGIYYAVGEEVVCEVEWPGGRRTATRGRLISIYNGEVFVESSMGPVAGILATLEKT